MKISKSDDAGVKRHKSDRGAAKKKARGAANNRRATKKTAKRSQQQAARSRSGQDETERVERQTPPFRGKKPQHAKPTGGTAGHENRKSNEAIANKSKRRQLRHVQRKSRVGPLTRSSAGGRGNAQTRRRKQG